MKKRIYWGFAFSLCCVIAVMFGLLGTPILLADITTFSPTNTQEISIDITDYTATNYTRIRYFDNAIYLIDRDGRKVIKHTATADTIIYNTQKELAQDTTEPYDIVSFGEDCLISTTTLFVDYVTSQGSTTLKSFKSESSPNGSAVLSPQTLTRSADGTTYMIYQNNILYYNTSESQLELFATLTQDSTELEFNAGGGFCVTENNSAIYFSIGTTIYKMDTQTHTITTQATTLENITYLNADNLGNIYYGNQNTIFKYKNDPANTTTASLPNNAISYDIDFVNGKIYYITDANAVFVTEIYANNENFVTNYSKIAPNKKLSEISASSDLITVVATTKTAGFYQYQSLLSKTSTYDAGKRLIVLDESNSQFYYIFDNNSTTTEGFRLGYVLKSDCEVVANEIASEFADNKAGKVITGITKIFAMPISQAIATDTYIASIGQLNYGDTIGIIASPILPTDSNGATFVAVQYQKDGTNYIGYIDSRTLVSSVLLVPDTKSVPNAKTKTETVIYSDKNCFNEIDIIAKGSDVKIVSTLNGVSKIEYYIKDGEDTIIKTGYCDAENLNNGNLTTAQIIGFVLMGISVIITITVLIILHRRKKKLATLPCEPSESQN